MTENVMNVRELFDFIVTDLETLNKSLDLSVELPQANDITIEMEDDVLDAYIDKVF
jgi:hypothetical protein